MAGPSLFTLRDKDACTLMQHYSLLIKIAMSELVLTRVARDAHFNDLPTWSSEMAL